MVHMGLYMKLYMKLYRIFIDFHVIFHRMCIDIHIMFIDFPYSFINFHYLNHDPLLNMRMCAYVCVCMRLHAFVCVCLRAKIVCNVCINHALWSWTVASNATFYIYINTLFDIHSVLKWKPDLASERKVCFECLEA